MVYLLGFTDHHLSSGFAETFLLTPKGLSVPGSSAGSLDSSLIGDKHLCPVLTVCTDIWSERQQQDKNLSSDLIPTQCNEQ